MKEKCVMKQGKVRDKRNVCDEKVSWSVTSAVNRVQSL